MVTPNNKTRGVVPEYLKEGQYRTEYKRLGVDPEDYDPKRPVPTAADKQSIAYHNAERMPPTNVPTRRAIGVNQPRYTITAPDQPVQHTIPKQTHVQVGNHDETASWASEESFAPKHFQPPPDAETLTEPMDVSSYQGVSTANQEMYVMASEPEPEVPVLQHLKAVGQQFKEPAPVPAPLPPTAPASLPAPLPAPEPKHGHYMPMQGPEKINPGEYLVVVDEKSKGFTSHAAAKDYVEMLVLKHDIGVHTIEVYQRLPIDFGITLG